MQPMGRHVRRSSLIDHAHTQDALDVAATRLSGLLNRASHSTFVRSLAAESERRPLESLSESGKAL